MTAKKAAPAHAESYASGDEFYLIYNKSVNYIYIYYF